MKLIYTVDHAYTVAVISDFKMMSHVTQDKILYSDLSRICIFYDSLIAQINQL